MFDLNWFDLKLLHIIHLWLVFYSHLC